MFNHGSIRRLFAVSRPQRFQPAPVHRATRAPAAFRPKQDSHRGNSRSGRYHNNNRSAGNSNGYRNQNGSNSNRNTSDLSQMIPGTCYYMFICLYIHIFLVCCACHRSPAARKESNGNKAKERKHMTENKGKKTKGREQRKEHN